MEEGSETGTWPKRLALKWRWWQERLRDRSHPVRQFQKLETTQFGLSQTQRCTPATPTLKRPRQEESPEFETNLGYTVNSRPAWTTERATGSQSQDNSSETKQIMESFWACWSPDSSPDVRSLLNIREASIVTQKWIFPAGDSVHVSGRGLQVRRQKDCYKSHRASTVQQIPLLC